MRIGRSLLVVLASVLLALGLCEGALHVFPGLLPVGAQLRVLWKDDELRPQTIADPYLGFRYPPQRTLVHRTRDFATVIRTDEHGMRNRSPWPPRAQVVIVGDSLAFGYGVDEEKTWARLLEREVRPAGLINISLPGFAPQQYFRYFETLGLPLRPRLVILCIFPGNDVLDAKRFATWEAAGSPGSFAAWQFSQEPYAQESGFAFELPEALQRIRLLLALDAIHDNLRNRFQSQMIELPQGRLNLTPGLYERRMGLFDASDPGFRALVNSVRSTRELAVKADARLLVVLFPTKEEIYLPARDVDFPDMISPIERALRALPVDVLDLSEGLRDHANDPRPLYFMVDGHPNERGNAVIAHLVAQRLSTLPHSPTE